MKHKYQYERESIARERQVTAFEIFILTLIAVLFLKNFDKIVYYLLSMK